MQVGIGHPPLRRPASPIMKMEKNKFVEMRPNGEQPDGSNICIRRIPLTRTAKVEVLNVESPSSVWVRLTNHITDQLTVTEPYDLDPVTEELNVYQYAMAPFGDRTYARCRILKSKQEYYKVRFIDYGSTQWVGKACLAKLPREFPFHPWQAILVAVADVSWNHEIGWEYDSTAKTTNVTWTKKQCSIFREIVSKYESFKVQALFGSVISNDYRAPVMVELFGYNADGDEESVGAIFAAVSNGAIRRLMVIDSSKIDLHDTPDEDDQPEDDLPGYFKKFPTAWIRASDRVAAAERDIWAGWSPKEAKIELHNAEYLMKNCSCFDPDIGDNGPVVLVQAEGSYTDSPYEWYARPLVAKYDEKGIRDDVETIISNDDELKAFADELESFYSRKNNRSLIDKDALADWLKTRDLNVFAVTTASDDRARYTGEWQRIQVLSILPSVAGGGDVAQILYLDSGGRDQISVNSLFKIHVDHCKRRPFCVQFCVAGIVDNEESELPGTNWSANSKRIWKSLLRCDVPLRLRRFKVPAEPREKPSHSTQQNVRYLDRNVIYVEDVIPVGEGDICLEMLRQGQGSVEEDPDKPIPFVDVLIS